MATTTVDLQGPVPRADRAPRRRRLQGFSSWRRATALPREEFERRHRGILWVIGLNLLGLPVFALLNGWSIGAGLLAITPAAGLAVLAAQPRGGATARASAAVLALLCCSAALVWLWDGTIEAHFHYFVVVGIVTLYEATLPYAIALAFVVLQHGVMSAWFPHRVFDHMADGASHGWTWAAVHGGFIAALGLANLASWRASDDVRVAEVAARDAALHSAQRFREAFVGAPNGAALVDADGTMLEVNEALAASVRAAPAALVDRQWFQLLPLGERPAAVAAWPPAEASVEQELPLRRVDGSVGSLLWRHTRLTTGDGRERWICQTVDTSMRRSAEASLATASELDALTGLPNRTAFIRRVQRALDEAPPGRTSAVLLVDLDDFGAFNAAHGYAAGDEVLVGVAARLRPAMRPEDVLARFGGDEFVVYLPGVAAAAAQDVVARLAAALEAPFVLDGVQRHVTAAFGVAGTDTGDGRLERLLREADPALRRG